MGRIFTKEESNFGRQKELDFAKGLAILFMMFVHVNEAYLSPDIEEGIYNKIIEFIGSPPAAPIFMMMLGVGIIYSKRSNAKMLFKRGCYLILLAYGLNFFRDYVPYFFLGKINNDVSYIEEGWELLWGVDILAFAGLAFLFFAFIKKFKIKNHIIFIMWCIFMTINMFARGHSFDNSIINGFFRLIWGTDENSWFPFLTWITYPIAGYFFAQLLIRCKDKNTLYKNILLITGPASIPLWIYSYINNVKFGAFGGLYQTEYYHHDLMGGIVLCTFALFWLSICYYISGFIPDSIQNVMERWSENINLMYCVHCLALGYGLFILEECSYMTIHLIIISIIFAIFTDGICIVINKVKSARYDLKMKKR